MLFFFSSRRRHTRWNCDWSSDVCSSDLQCGGRFGDDDRIEFAGVFAVLVLRRGDHVARGFDVRLERARDTVGAVDRARSEEHTSELQSQFHLVCRLLLEKKKWRAMIDGS